MSFITQRHLKTTRICEVLILTPKEVAELAGHARIVIGILLANCHFNYDVMVNNG